jgi:hypothetical protein
LFSSARFKDFILNANVTHKINDLEKLLNVSYLRDVIVPEIERMVKESNIDTLYDEARQFLNTTFLIETVIPEIEKVNICLIFLPSSCLHAPLKQQSSKTFGYLLFYRYGMIWV